VGDAFSQFHLEKSEIIHWVFRQVGPFQPIDGSCDAELNIRGFPGVEVGDWHRDYEDSEVGVEQELEMPEADNNDFIEFIHTHE